MKLNRSGGVSPRAVGHRNLAVVKHGTNILHPHLHFWHVHFGSMVASVALKDDGKVEIASSSSISVSKPTAHVVVVATAVATATAEPVSYASIPFHSRVDMRPITEMELRALGCRRRDAAPLLSFISTSPTHKKEKRGGDKKDEDGSDCDGDGERKKDDENEGEDDEGDEEVDPYEPRSPPSSYAADDQ